MYHFETNLVTVQKHLLFTRYTKFNFYNYVYTNDIKFTGQAINILNYHN